MQGIIGIEKQLAQLADLLETEGYNVVALDGNNLDEVDAIVVNSTENSIINIQGSTMHVPIIDAAGKTDEQILKELERL